jgi:hypothetical protein
MANHRVPRRLDCGGQSYGPPSLTDHFRAILFLISARSFSLPGVDETESTRPTQHRDPNRVSRAPPPGPRLGTCTRLKFDESPPFFSDFARHSAARYGSVTCYSLLIRRLADPRNESRIMKSVLWPGVLVSPATQFAMILSPAGLECVGTA